MPKINHIKPKVEITHTPGVNCLNSPAKLFIPTKAKNPNAIPAAIENVSGMTSIITSTGNVSLTSSQFTFLKLLRKVAATIINAGSVAKLSIEANKGSKKRCNKSTTN